MVDDRYSGQTKVIDDDGFELAESRFEKKKLNDIKFMNIKLVGTLPLLVDIWIYKVLEGNAFAVKEYTGDNDIKVDGATKTLNVDAKYKSFRATVFKTDIKKIRSFGL